MNLEFITIKNTDIGGMPYFLQRAEVTNNRLFWHQWRSPEVKERLKSIVSFRREIIEGRKRYFIFRHIPVDNSRPPAKVPPYLPRNTKNLLPYQPKSLSHICAAILHHGSAVDASDTGTGKTFVSLAACRELGYTPAIICKKNAISSWMEACKYMQVRPYFVRNWEIVKTGKFPFCKRAENGRFCNFTWGLQPKTILIFDEVHMANNPTSINYALWTSARECKIPTISLSATLADKPIKLMGLMYVLGAMRPQEFRNHLQERGNFLDRYDKIESIDDEGDMLYFNRFLFPEYGFRLSYEHPEVKKFFGDAAYQTHLIDIGQSLVDRQNRLYSECIKKAAEFHEKGKQAQKLVAELRYRQASEILKVHALHELCRDYIEQGKSVVLFVNFRETLFYLKKLFKTGSVIYGQQEDIERELVIKKFQNNLTPLIIATIAAGGTSINLHDISGGRQRIALICPTYNPVDLKQACGRIHRAGSKTMPIIKLVYAAGTIEQKVSIRVNEKIRNIAKLNEGDLVENDLFLIK